MNKSPIVVYLPVSVDERLPTTSTVDKMFYEVILSDGTISKAVRYRDGSFIHHTSINSDKRTITHWLEPQTSIVLSVDEWEKVKIKDDIIRNLQEQIEEAHKRLDELGAPKFSVRDNHLTILGRLDGCYYPKDFPPQLNEVK